MAREDTPLDQQVFDQTLEAELAKGTDRRVAEGRARSAAVKAYRAKSGEGGAPDTVERHRPASPLYNGATVASARKPETS